MAEREEHLKRRKTTMGVLTGDCTEKKKRMELVGVGRKLADVWIYRMSAVGK